MLRQILIILLLTTISSCSTDKKNEKVISKQVKCFSTFIYSDRYGDNTRHFFPHTFLFKADTLVTLSSDTNFQWVATKRKLTPNQIDSINFYLTKLNFNQLADNNSIVSMFRDTDIYCGATYGFVDSTDRPEVYIPYKETSYTYPLTEKLTEILFSIKGQKTVDTVEIIRQTLLIKNKYQATAPPPPILETVKFVPPVIKEYPGGH